VRWRQVVSRNCCVNTAGTYYFAVGPMRGEGMLVEARLLFASTSSGTFYWGAGISGSNATTIANYEASTQIVQAGGSIVLVTPRRVHSLFCATARIPIEYVFPCAVRLTGGSWWGVVCVVSPVVAESTWVWMFTIEGGPDPGDSGGG
jgi:hypothetical protein